MMRGATLIALFVGTVAAPALGQSVTLTADDGRPLIVGAAELGSGLATSHLGGEAIVTEFRRLCLPDPAGAPGRVDGSALGLKSNDAVFAPAGKQGEARVTRWSGPSAELSVWLEDDTNLRGRPVAIPSRGSTTTGPYGPFRAKGKQCNLVVVVKDFVTATQISDALTSAVGPPGKLVAKKTFADGYWSVPGSAPSVRINFTTPSIRDGPRPVHLSAQVVEKGSKR
jgi:hypothetical protein